MIDYKVNLNINFLTVGYFDFFIDSLRLSLANNESIKCIVLDNDGKDALRNEIIFTKCWYQIFFELIEKWNRFDPFLVFLRNNIESFHTRNKCSTKTAVCFAILLWKRTSMVKKKMLNNRFTNFLAQFLTEIVERSIEHVVEAKLIKLDKKIIKTEANHTFYKRLLKGLCRGDEKNTKILIDLIQLNRNNLKLSKDNISIISTSTQTIIQNDYLIVEGIIMKANNEIIKHLQNNNTNINTLYIDASLTLDYVHLGFNKDIKSKQIITTSSQMNVDHLYSKWLNNIKSILIDHKIKLILTTGTKVDSGVCEFCQVNSIIIVDNISLKMRSQITKLFKCSALFYIEDFNDSIHLFKSNIKTISCQSDNESFIHLYSNEPNSNQNFMASILIKNRLSTTNQMIKEKLEHDMCRLLNVINSNSYLLGNGQIERYLAHDIIKTFKLTTSTNNEDEIYYELAKDCIVDSLKDFNDLIVKNGSVETFDDFQSKTNAWRNACFINSFLLKIDVSIRK
jgi:hypothetical protein